ncbi:MAG: tetratricopeptide repeat protein [Chromatiales bacterium]
MQTHCAHRKAQALWLIPCFLLIFAIPGCSDSDADPLRAFQRGDYETALLLWRQRADTGDGVAQNYLGVHYHLGLGVASDYREAVKWYARAAENGNPDAQRNLGTMYYLGLGVPQDNGLAYGWYYVAAKNGNLKAEDARQSMMDEMTPNHVRLSERRIKGYLIEKGILKRVMSNGQLEE